MLVALMFISLLAAASIVQGTEAGELDADGRNARSIVDAQAVRRGSIRVASHPIAESVGSDRGDGYRRIYANGPLYASVTGFAPKFGQPTGIEGAMDAELAGRSDTSFFDRLAAVVDNRHPTGMTVDLTIDPVAQKAAFNALGNYQGAAVVLEPSTGRVLAMVSKPTFDPNTLGGTSGQATRAQYRTLLKADGDPLIDRAIAGNLNPPGSTFKLVVTSAALASGKFTEQSVFANPQSLTLPETSTIVFNDTFERCGPGTETTIARALVLSCNIPFAELGMTLGSAAIRRQAEAFGFNQSLNIPIPVQTSSYPKYHSDAETGMSAFGQIDDRATPMQIAQVSAAIANDGRMMKPNLVEDVRSENGSVAERFEPQLLNRATTPNVAARVKALMVDGVDHGAASNARIPGVAVAGKTGTAQNGPSDPFSLWFTGFAPADHPKYAVAVVIEDGGGRGQQGSGSSIAAPVARRIFTSLLAR